MQTTIAPALIGRVLEPTFATELLRTMPTEIDAALAELRAANFDVRGTRLARYAETIRTAQARSHRLDDSAEIEGFTTAVQESKMLIESAKHLRLHAARSGWERRYKISLQGNDLPADGADQARDALAEVFFAASIARRECTVVFDEKPDLRISRGGVEFPVAVKRPRMTTTIGRALRDATKQIADAGSPGLIALDLTIAFQQHHGLWEFDAFDKRLESRSHVREDFIAKMLPDLRARVDACPDGQSVGGVVVFVHAALVSKSTGGLGLLDQWVLYDLHRSEKHAADAFAAISGGRGNSN